MPQQSNIFDTIPNKDATPRERLEKLKDAIDEDGRLFWVDENDDNKIYLTVPGSVGGVLEKTPIGHILIGENHLLYHKYEDERYIFRNTNSWSINYKVFELVDHIVYESLKYSYSITKERASEFGTVQHHPQVEKKIYIPLKYWDTRHNGVDKVEERRRNLLGDSWYTKLKPVIDSEYMSAIGNRLRLERRTKVIYPDEKDVFRAFELCTFEHTKVVIVGQNPYYQPNVADGLAFSYKGGIRQPKQKALDVILKEIERDVYEGFNVDIDYNLAYLAKQGVLLLNSSLTVEKGKPESHLDIGWQRFIKIVLYELLKDIEPKAFMLWGNVAQNLFNEVLAKVPTVGKHLTLFAKHPAYDVRLFNEFGETAPNYPNTFAGCKHFSQANEFLQLHKRKIINW